MKNTLFICLFILSSIGAVPTNAQDGAWHKNELHGVTFETPKQVMKQAVPLPAGSENQISKYEAYISTEGKIITLFFYAESNFIDYDKQTGIDGAIGNMVRSMKGTDLKMEYDDPSNDLDDLRCSGSFVLNGKPVNVEGYVYWNGMGKFLLLASFGESEKVEDVKRVVGSLVVEVK
jgi:hypothetical protein